VKYGGFAAILFFTPIVSFFSYGLMAIFPALAIIRVMKIAENSSHYSAHNTARNLIWLPTSPNTIYKAKSAIDTVFVRAGDALAALTVLVVSNLWGASLGQLIMLNVGLVLIWGGIAWVLVRENQRLTSQSNPGSVHV
jgi:AAA family ATP:ADP antiporter